MRVLATLVVLSLFGITFALSWGLIHPHVTCSAQVTRPVVLPSRILNGKLHLVVYNRRRPQQENR